MPTPRKPQPPQPELPLTEATYFILLSLASRPKHGYSIIKEVAGLSEARIRLSAGTLYGVLKRLLEQGWIERHDDPEGGREDTGRTRKVYGLTELGQRILAAEVQRLQQLVQAARQQIVRAAS